MSITVRTIGAFFFLAALLSCEKKSAAPPSGVQVTGRVEITVTDTGYEPYEVHASKGKPLTMVFTRKSDGECGEEVVVPEHNIRMALPIGEPVEITFTPTKTGRLAFTCGMSMMRGAIIVQ